MRIAFIIALLLTVAGCASAPSQIRNACAIFDQRDGWTNNWRRASERTARKYGVPVPILLATIYTESSFKPYARPPRRKLLGFIPWKRPSSAYGYSQALDGTWARYKRETGDWSARRTNFADAINFIGWYHNQSARKTGISLKDPYRLYLAYHSGHQGYLKGAWRRRPEATQGARRFADIAYTYSRQLKNCN